MILKIVYFGSSGFSVPFLKKIIGSGHEVVAVFTNADKKKGRGRKLTSNPVKAAAESAGIKVFEIDKMDKDFIKDLSAIDFDYGVVISFGMIFGAEIFEKWPGKWINLHPSMLPRYRGPSPMISALLDGAVQTGVTINDVVHKVDTGSIFAQARFNIDPEDNLECLENKVIHFGGPLLIAVLDMIGDKNYKPYSQGEEGVSYTRKITKDDLIIDWNGTGEDIINRIRALSPAPGAYGVLEGERVKILKASVYDDTIATGSGDTGMEKAIGMKPAGTIVSASPKGGLLVRCGSKEIISIEKLQPAGKKPMDYKSFINGYHPETGARFETR